MKRSFMIALLLAGSASSFAQDVPPDATSDSEAPPASENDEAANPAASDAPASETDVASEADVASETDAASVNDSESASANAATPSEASSGPRAKFALVLVGDADAALQTRAAELSEALHDAGLTGVHDGAIYEALLGRGGEEDDALGPLRRARRVLSLSEDAGARAEALDLIGRASGADALVLIARRAPTLRVYDLGARSFFEAVPPSPGDVRYIVSATQAAADRAITAPSLVAEAAEDEAEVDVETEEDVPPVRAFFRKNWPYMVAGVLLAGAVVWLAVGSGGNDETPAPVLRFRPGSSDE